ncbi:hypothetical protein M441DRAFT_59046 [Trichoderma asperellum CBS 433.97]|uniref:Uncharacterized protein n=1 Tax=Trichoderma asperellum (strain ATCC 204424 / CBS 433.97 / NBRC 101777) TaxID=1042311 RepID=A0A2T3Z5Z5_TRIA4|nr:hypothetical protein M441DRAFT_59046 [Trichoderma asperellum CBS 433.97]PTB40246.1 hypothetical protein M441DRAFT_59046 [Trichoderma asperellum CBS 433.97]
MRFTAATAVSLLAGSAIAAPADMNMNSSKAADMSTDASSITNIRLADMFSERQMAVLKVLSKHQQELGMSQEEMQMMDAFMAALHGDAAGNVKRDDPAPVDAVDTAPVDAADTAPVDAADTAPVDAADPTVTPTSANSTALDILDGVIAALTAAGSNAATPVAGADTTGVNSTAAGALGSSTGLLSILKGIPVLGALLGTATSTAGGATSGLGSATSGLSNLTGGCAGGLGALTGGLGGLKGGLGGLTGGLGLLGGLNKGGLLGGILIPGIL